MYRASLTKLREQLYSSGAAEEILTRRANVLRKKATELVDAATIASESSRISTYFTVT